ncbi:MAG: hypothetical protein DA408_18980, partial [Bacteroidetes bacterium]
QKSLRALCGKNPLVSLEPSWQKSLRALCHLRALCGKNPLVSLEPSWQKASMPFVTSVPSVVKKPWCPKW